jgi:hypothetical protein
MVVTAPMRVVSSALLLGLGLLAALGQPRLSTALEGQAPIGTGDRKLPPEAWNAPRIVRLQPRAFRALPRSVVMQLERLGCTIPQSFIPTKRPQNVIRGQFQRSGQDDWAVLCSRHRVSSILVFWKGVAGSFSELASVADATFLQDTGLDHDGRVRVGYSRMLSTADRKTILAYRKAFDSPDLRRPYPPVIDHQGIEDAFLEKASHIYYRHRGHWWTLLGAD